MKNFLKGKIKNKFIVGIILVILLIVGSQGFRAISLLGTDTSSYVVLVAGEGVLNDGALKIHAKEKLSIGDAIVTVGEKSVAVVEWGDGSLTRLGGDSKVIINELDVEKDLSKINLSFTLENGKTWSNVVSFLGEESYFKQKFEDVEASVRGTVFDVDLTADYVFVQNHEVALQKGENSMLVKENTALSISTFTLIELQKFLNTIRDKAWEGLNEKMDGEYFDALKKELSETFSQEKLTVLLSDTIGEKAESLEELEENIGEFSTEKKKEIYEDLLTQYQKLNFISAGDGELFATKNEIKKILIKSADQEDKKTLVKYSLYDLKDAIDLKNIGAVKDSLSLIGENKDVLDTIDTDIFNDLELIPGPLKSLFEDNVDLMKNIFGARLPDLFPEDFTLDNAKDILDSSTKGTTDVLNKGKEKLSELLNNFK